jgi:hypothetical protein
MKHRQARSLHRLFASRAAVVTFVSIGFLSCDHTPSWRQHTFTPVELSHVPESVALPRTLWEKIEGLINSDSETPAAGEGKPEGKKEGEGNKAAEGGSSGGKPHTGLSLPTVFAPLKIFLVEKNKGILTRGNTQITFGPGGGEMDLQDFVQERNGSFSMVAEFVPELEGAQTHVYFLSNSVIRHHDKEILGSGCDTYFDVTSAFAKAAKLDGFLINTTDNRHISALAGTYFFASVHEHSLYLASLVIRDSIQHKLQCNH